MVVAVSGVVAGLTVLVEVAGVAKVITAFRVISTRATALDRRPLSHKLANMDAPLHLKDTQTSVTPGLLLPLLGLPTAHLHHTQHNIAARDQLGMVEMPVLISELLRVKILLGRHVPTTRCRRTAVAVV